MDRIRRVGGEMESPRRPAGPRLLLPYEVQLCEAVGISAEEYWEFFDRVTQAEEERKKEYELVPNIQAGIDPITIAIVQIVVGLALTAASILLAPKPKAPSQKQNKGERVTVEGIDGRSRFSPTYQFDAIQDLATLAALPPTNFCST